MDDTALAGKVNTEETYCQMQKRLRSLKGKEMKKPFNTNKLEQYHQYCLSAFLL